MGTLILSFLKTIRKLRKMKLLCRQTDNLIIVDFSGFYEEKIQKWQTSLYRKPTLEDVDLAMQDGVIVR